jgi:hypothetical protein
MLHLQSSRASRVETQGQEEQIKEATEGKFRKYFNNTSPVPCQFSEDMTANRLCDRFSCVHSTSPVLENWQVGFRGRLSRYTHPTNTFCCFSLAATFFLGGNTLLMDPQIITHPRYGYYLFRSLFIPMLYPIVLVRVFLQVETSQRIGKPSRGFMNARHGASIMNCLATMMNGTMLTPICNSSYVT